ncbi:MAG: endonuclease [Rhodobacter sp.]|nr:endonuclease [Rhodobacter sp.]
MYEKQTSASMTMTALIAGGVGLVAFVALMVIGDYRFAPALFLALILAIVVFVVLLIGFHRKTGPMTTGGGGTSAAGSGSTGGAPAASAGAGSTGGATAASAGAAASGADSSSGAPAAAASGADSSSGAPAAAAASSAATTAPADAGGSPVKPSKPLAGQEELAAKKGEWTYDGGGADAGAAAAGDGEVTGAGAAAETEPQTYSAPPDDGADDLKVIKGVGPGLEKTLNGLGIYKYAQIADWGPSEIAWVDARLKFKGRIERDGWIAQAKDLAGG